MRKHQSSRGKFKRLHCSPLIGHSGLHCGPSVPQGQAMVCSVRAAPPGDAREGQVLPPNARSVAGRPDVRGCPVGDLEDDAGGEPGTARSEQPAGRVPLQRHRPVERLAGCTAACHRRSATAEKAGHQGPAFLRHRVGRQPRRLVHGADVPAQRPHADADGRERAGRPQDQGAHPLCGAAVGGRGQPQQLPGHQPRGAAARAADQGRESVQGHAAADGRHAQGPCLPDRRERVRGGPQRGQQRRRGGVRERTVPADRIQAPDGQGA